MFIRITTALAATLLLAACSAFPLPAQIDLREQLTEEERSGSAQFPVAEAAPQDVEVALPSVAGQCVDLTADDVPVTVESAQVHWNVAVTYDGPELEGRVQARLYVAAPGEELFASRNTLGPTETLNLNRTETRFAGTANLSPRQLEALNDRRVCWGVQVRGDDLAAQEAGVATLHYDIRDLRLDIRFSVI